jgi:hypothetical protein
MTKIVEVSHDDLTNEKNFWDKGDSFPEPTLGILPKLMQKWFSQSNWKRLVASEMEEMLGIVSSPSAMDRM